MALHTGRARKVSTTVVGTLFWLPVAVLYALLAAQLFTVPLIDDFAAVLAFATQLEARTGLRSKLAFAVFTQTGDYKLIFQHLLIAAQLAVVPHVSFRFLVLLGDALLLPMLYVLYRRALPATVTGYQRVWLLLPLPFLLFQLNYAETLNWAMGSLQNLAVISFGLLALDLLLRPERWHLGAACVCGVLSAASSSNGFALVFAGLLILWVQRNGKAALVWIACFAAMLAVYLVQYQRPALPTGAPWWRKLLFLLSFLGSVAENMHGRPVPHASIVLGAVLLGAIASMLWRQRASAHVLFLGAAFVWILSTAAMVASVRIRLGMQLALSVRYKIYGDLLLIVAYSLLINRVRGTPRVKTVLVPSLLTAMLLCTASDVLGWRFLQKRRLGMEAAMRAFERDPQTASPMYLNSPSPSEGERAAQEVARRQMVQAMAHGLYTPPPL